MPYDGIITKHVISELNNVLLGAKVTKIYQPNKNEILISFYSHGKTYTLDISISPLTYRLHLSTNSKPNPLTAPSFCMLLRKHLIGSKLASIQSEGLERIVTLDFSCFNELNDLSSKKLIIELMGKHSNIILLNQNERIIDSLRHLEKSAHSDRDILPSRPYVLPRSEKIELTLVHSFLEFYEICSNQKYDKISDLIPSTFKGISKTFINYLLQIKSIEDNISKDNLEKFWILFQNYIKNIGSTNLSCIPFSNDYTIVHKKVDNNLFSNFFLDDFYHVKEEKQHFVQYRENVLKLILNTSKKIEKKLSNILSKLDDCRSMDIYRLYGELLTANLYKISSLKNQCQITVENYYQNNELITIPLDPSISPSCNAKKYFKKYHKLKNALEIVSKQKIETEKEIRYLESIVYEIENARNIEEIDDIYHEIRENILFKNTTNKPKKVNLSKQKQLNRIETPMEFLISGYTVLVGKNNKQNDYLTLKIAKPYDIWFHTKFIHGSHVILRTNKSIPSDNILQSCAELAAYYSKAKNSSKVPVDYTLAKYVKKPSGSKPGMVIYTNEHTLYVMPKNKSDIIE